MPRDDPNLDTPRIPDNTDILEDLVGNNGNSFEKIQFDEIDLNAYPSVILSTIRKNNLNRIVIGHLNINFLAGKLEALKQLIKEKLDILVLTEIKSMCLSQRINF